MPQTRKTPAADERRSWLTWRPHFHRPTRHVDSRPRSGYHLASDPGNNNAAEARVSHKKATKKNRSKKSKMFRGWRTRATTHRDRGVYINVRTEVVTHVDPCVCPRTAHAEMGLEVAPGAGTALLPTQPGHGSGSGSGDEQDEASGQTLAQAQACASQDHRDSTCGDAAAAGSPGTCAGAPDVVARDADAARSVTFMDVVPPPGLGSMRYSMPVPTPGASMESLAVSEAMSSTATAASSTTTLATEVAQDDGEEEKRGEAEVSEVNPEESVLSATTNSAIAEAQSGSATHEVTTSVCAEDESVNSYSNIANLSSPVLEAHTLPLVGTCARAGDAYVDIHQGEHVHSHASKHEQEDVDEGQRYAGCNDVEWQYNEEDYDADDDEDYDEDERESVLSLSPSGLALAQALELAPVALPEASVTPPLANPAALPLADVRTHGSASTQAPLPAALFYRLPKHLSFLNPYDHKTHPVSSLPTDFEPTPMPAQTDKEGLAETTLAHDIAELNAKIDRLVRRDAQTPAEEVAPQESAQVERAVQKRSQKKETADALARAIMRNLGFGASAGQKQKQGRIALRTDDVVLVTPEMESARLRRGEEATRAREERERSAREDRERLEWVERQVQEERERQIQRAMVLCHGPDPFLEDDAVRMLEEALAPEPRRISTITRLGPAPASHSQGGAPSRGRSPERSCANCGGVHGLGTACSSGSTTVPTVPQARRRGALIHFVPEVSIIIEEDEDDEASDVTIALVDVDVNIDTSADTAVHTNLSPARTSPNAVQDTTSAVRNTPNVITHSDARDARDALQMEPEAAEETRVPPYVVMTARAEEVDGDVAANALLTRSADEDINGNL